jgi:hypothetical protein
MSIILRRAALAAAIVAVAAGTGRAQDKKLDAGQQADVRAMVLAVDDVTAGKPAPSTLPVTWAQSHFIKAQAEKTYVPFVIDIDATGLESPAHLGMYLRVAPRGDTELASTPPPVDPKKKGQAVEGRHQFTFEDVTFLDVTPAAGQPAHVSRAFAVPPGEYDVYVAIEDRSSETAAAPAAGAAPAAPAAAPGAAAAPAEAPAPKMGVVKHELSVPNLQGGELTTSSVIVAQSVDVLQAPLPNDRQADNPYTFGQMKITPASSMAFTKKDDLNVIFWIYGAQPDPATKKPNVTVEYSFNQKTADGEKYFNRTDPQEMNASTLQVPLASFPVGDYHLQIKVTDKVSNQSVSRDVNFSVADGTAQQ